LGFNYRMSDLHAALGGAQLRRLPEILAARARVAAWYSECLATVPGLRLPPSVPGERASWFVYVVELTEPSLAARRDTIAAALRARDVQCATYFPPVHLQPPYRTAFGHRPGDFPETEALSLRTLALPFFTKLTHGQVEEVTHALRETLAAERRGAPGARVAPCAI
jgi:perosamine synthetase